MQFCFVDLEDARGPAALDGQRACGRAGARDRAGGVAQFERTIGQVDGCLAGEGDLVEGDGVAAVQEIGQVDGLAEAELAESRADLAI